jgi:hypothetical protein
MKFKTQPQALGSLEIGEKVLMSIELAATLIGIEPPNDRGLCKVTWKLPEVNVKFHTYGTRYTSVDKVVGEEEEETDE